jgi:hypothetical protein
MCRKLREHMQFYWCWHGDLTFNKQNISRWQLNAIKNRKLFDLVNNLFSLYWVLFYFFYIILKICKIIFFLETFNIIKQK